MTWQERLSEGTRVLEEAQIEDASLDAWYLLEHVTGMSRAGFILHGSEEEQESQAEQYMDLIRRRAAHTPLQHLTGTQQFMGIDFIVSEDVLCPRQDTELLVERVLAREKESGLELLDVCTGSGCIAIALERLGQDRFETVDAVDLSPQALQIAEHNCAVTGAQVHLRQSDLLESVTGHYDVIVSNPPYIASQEVDRLMPEVREHEPRMALDGGADGLDLYRRLAAGVPGHLKPGGRLYLEIGYDQGQSVPGLLLQAGFVRIGCHKDLCGLDRVVEAVWPGKEG